MPIRKIKIHLQFIQQFYLYYYYSISILVIKNINVNTPQNLTQLHLTLNPGPIQEHI